MSARSTVTGASLKQAIEQRDGPMLASFYADDAVIRIIDRQNPPSRPREIRGADIASYWNDVCDRDMTHRVESTVAEGPTLALTESCAYPDGTRVFCASVMELAQGRITRQTIVQAWDE